VNKKHYIVWFIIGTFLVFSLLPLFNYIVDRWRVLHSDYTHYYAGEMCNKTFLKTKYLVEHPKQYDTLLMGSSNGGYIDTTFISDHAYNMKYNFGLLAIHVENLKTMLKNGVKIKNLWVGINDYIIWKDPKDYKNSFERRPYKADFVEDIKTYMFYLFRKPDLKDYYLFEGKYKLLNTEIISNPQPHIEARKREKAHMKDKKAWNAHMKNSDPILLGYDNSTYRIDKAIEEIKDLKSLCKTYDINLTLFMYPVFYKTYFSYNQKRIEEFKRKLVKVISFYDFYHLNNYAYDGENWQDSMHFSYSMGNRIIYSIKNNKLLDTVENIESVLAKDHQMLKEFLLSKFKLYSIFNIEMDSSIFYSLLKVDSNLLNNNQKIPSKINIPYGDINITKLDDATILYLPSIAHTSSRVLLSIDMDSEKTSNIILYYKENETSSYDEAHSLRPFLNRGKNYLHVLLPANVMKNGLRIDFRNDRGKFTIHSFSLYDLSR